MLQWRANNRSNSYVHFRISVSPFRAFNIIQYSSNRSRVYNTSRGLLCVKCSDILNGGTPMRKCTRLLLLLSPLTVTSSAVAWLVQLGIIDSNRFGMANGKPTEFDSAVVTSSGQSVRSTLHSMQLFRSWRTRTHRGMRYPNMTWRISSYMITCLPHCHCTSGPEYFLSKAHMLYVIDVVLRKALVYLRRLLSTLHILSMNYYLVCSLPLHKICELNFCAINDGKHRRPWNPGSRTVNSLKVTPVNSSCVISY